MCLTVLFVVFLQTLSTQFNSLAFFVQRTVAFILSMGKFEPFITITADELVFGYDDKLVTLAHQFYPKNKRPMEKMGLFLGVSKKINLADLIRK